MSSGLSCELPVGLHLSQQNNAIIRAINPDVDEHVDFKGLKGKIDYSTAGAQFIWQQCQKWDKPGELVGQM